MPTTTAPPSATSNGHGLRLPPPGAARSPRLAARHRTRAVAGGALLAFSALAAVVLYGSVGDRQPVLAVARPVAAGQTINAQDIRVVNVSADPGVRTVPAADRTRLVGRTATVALAPGALLSPSQVGDGPVLPAGSVIVGAVLKPGYFPLGLRTGDSVLVVALRSVGGSAGVSDAEQVLASPVKSTVAAIERLADSGGASAVSLACDPDIAPVVAAAGAEGRLSVILQLP